MEPIKISYLLICFKQKVLRRGHEYNLVAGAGLEPATSWL